MAQTLCIVYDSGEIEAKAHATVSKTRTIILRAPGSPHWMIQFSKSMDGCRVELFRWDTGWQNIHGWRYDPDYSEPLTLSRVTALYKAFESMHGVSLVKEDLTFI